MPSHAMHTHPAAPVSKFDARMRLSKISSPLAPAPELSRSVPDARQKLQLKTKFADARQQIQIRKQQKFLKVQLGLDMRAKLQARRGQSAAAVMTGQMNVEPQQTFVTIRADGGPSRTNVGDAVGGANSRILKTVSTGGQAQLTTTRQFTTLPPQNNGRLVKNFPLSIT